MQKRRKRFYRVVDLSVEYKKNQPDAAKAYARLSESYRDSAWTGKAKARLGAGDKKPKTDPEIRMEPVPVIASTKQANRRGRLRVSGTGRAAPIPGS